MKNFILKKWILMLAFMFVGWSAMAQDWVCVPESCSRAGYGNLSPIAFHPTTGEPYKVAKSQNNSDLSVERFHNNVWEFISGNMTTSGYQYWYEGTETASIAFHPTTNEPYVAFSQRTNVGDQIKEVHVKRYTGGEWVSVGDKLNINTCDAKFPKIVFNTSSNEPYVAFSNEDCEMWSTAQYLRVKRFDGNSWVEVGSSSLNQSSFYWGDHCIAINPVTHKPWVTWSEGDFIYIKRWNGNSWDLDGTFGGMPNGGEDPKIDFEPTTGIGWFIRRLNGALNVHYKPGNYWNESIYDLTGNLSVGLFINLHCRATGDPVVVWGPGSGMNPEIHGKTYTSGQWLTLGSTIAGDDPLMTIHPQTDETYILYEGKYDQWNTGPMVKRYNIPPPPMQLVFTTTANNQSIELPFYGTVNCTVDWGDNSATQDFTTEGMKSHTFATAGTYTVSISGDLSHFGNDLNGWTGVNYLTEVTDFGGIGLTSLQGAFVNADNLTSVPAPLPATITNLQDAYRNVDKVSITNLNSWDVSQITNMSNMFYGAENFNQDISGWNVSSVTNMSGMFYNAAAFEQNLGNWQIGAVTNMTGMFSGVTLETTNYDAILTGWAAQTVQSGVTFSGGNSKYSSGDATTARSSLTGAPNNWTITDGGQLPPFIGGDGSEGNPYQISTLNDLLFISENPLYWASGLYFEQTTELTFSAADFETGGDFYNGGAGFIPIGNATTKFQGNYDGSGHTISGLYINRPTENNIGLFGYVGDYSADATISNHYCPTKFPERGFKLNNILIINNTI